MEIIVNSDEDYLNYLKLIDSKVEILKWKIRREIPPLPIGLKELYCSDNKLTNLPPLPTSLTVLNCSNNKLTKLSHLSRVV